jgi:hypothetical protein
MPKMHSSEAFYASDDPLEAAIFSVLVEIMKEREKGKERDGQDRIKHNIYIFVECRIF